MKKKKIVNPLLKRIPKELLNEWRKYLVIFIFLSLTISAVSGIDVANNSMLTALENAKGELDLEDGHFVLDEEASEEFIEKIESGEKIDLRQFYIDEAHDEIDEKVVEEGEKELKKTVEEELRKTIKEEITKKATDAVMTAIEPMKAFMTKEQIDAEIDEAVEKALDENLEKVYEENYDEAYEEALKSDEYKDALEEARADAYKEAEDEINEEFDDIDAKKSKSELESEANFKVTPVEIYPFFYKDVDEDNDLDGEPDGRIRIYAVNDEINKADFLEGRAPENDGEIAIDRMHADNVNLTVGDVVKVGDEEFKIVGLLAYVNYSTLYENNTDIMFDAISFDVAMVTKDGWDKVNSKINYSYSFKYADASYNNDNEEKVLSDNFMQALASQCVAEENDLLDYVPRYANQAVIFAPDDLGGDKVMAGVLIYILVVVMAFIFAITISSTITKESSVIGTLRASGYTKWELIKHYTAMPIIVTFLAAIAGNILGYTYLKDVAVSMYYNSYSLPTYVTLWNYEAFVKTTLIPVLLMIIVNYVVVIRMMRFTPLQFLRHNLKTSKKKKAMRLPRFKFINRFRLRIMLQNIPNYLVLCVGIFFVLVLLVFAFGLPDTLDNYQEKAVDQMYAKYQYVLKSTEDDDGDLITTKAAGAEKYSQTSLKSVGGARDGEAVSVLGIEDDSTHITLNGEYGEGDVSVSSAYADKFGLSIGDEITLKEKYNSTEYTFKVKDIYDYMGGIAVFMPLDNYNETFGYVEGSFNGYMADERITDIDDKYIYMSITEDDITKVSRQLDHSMGGYMDFFKVICFLLSLVLIYLLTKVIIEKNENSISMTKILGYSNGEIGGLYLLPTSIVVVISSSIMTFGSVEAIKLLWIAIMKGMDGWLPAYVSPLSMIYCVAIVVASYLLVMLIDFRRIKKVPMDEALKNVE